MNMNQVIPLLDAVQRLCWAGASGTTAVVLLECHSSSLIGLD